MLPALAVFLGTLSLDWSERRRLTLVAIALGVLGAFVGLTQVSQGPFSALRFFETAHKSEAVGFFVNRNHFAALLYCLLLLVTAWLIHAVFEVSANRCARQSLDGHPGGYRGAGVPGRAACGDRNARDRGPV